MVADELRRQADTFLELLDLEPQIARTQYRDDRANGGYGPGPGPMDDDLS
jgi:hypothetical protein